MADNEELGMSLHLTNGIDIEAVGLKGSKYEGSKYGTRFENGIVVLDLIGPIYPRANMMTQMSGAVSLQQFTQDFIKSYNDPDVKGIVLNIDSPGGDVRGLGDASNLMYGLSKKRKKPVKAFASGYMASAAYYLGSVAQEIVGSKSSITGSIGTVLSGRKLSEDEYEIVSSQSPNKRADPTTDEGLPVILEMLDDMCQVFIDDVAQFRGITSAQVLSDYGQGKTFVGPRAKKQGLIDSIGTLGSVVESMAVEAQTKSYRQPRKVSAEVETLLSFTNEECEIMGLKDLKAKFAASNDLLAGVADGEQAQPDTATEESEDSVANEGQGHVEESAPADPQVINATREELEERFSDGAELFATQMMMGNHIFPAQQAHAASSLLIAKIDDSLVGGKVSYVDANGDLAEGTREEAVRATFEAMPKHSMTKKAIAGVKDGSVEAKVLKEEDPKTSQDDDDGDISAERREELLNQSDLGQRVIARGSAQ